MKKFKKLTEIMREMNEIIQMTDEEADKFDQEMDEDGYIPQDDLERLENDSFD